MHDDPLGLNRGGAAGADPGTPSVWRLPHQEPTNLIVLWPDDAAPTQAEIIAALRAYWDGVEIVDEIDPLHDDMPWAVIVRAEPLQRDAIVWSEPARPIPPGELDDPTAEHCKWVIGIETQIDPRNPLESYRDLVRFIAEPFDDVPGILDVNTTGWIRKRAITEQFLPEDNIPPVEVLWIVHAVSADPAHSPRGGVWLHTHGLWRCGRPELEMLEVDPDYGSDAGNLINEIAERILDEPPPEPGEPFHLGENLAVTLQPWQEVAPYVSRGAPGGMPDREEDENGVHTGLRAVICDEKQKGTFKKVWTWPRTAIDRLNRDQAVIWKSARATQRIATQARYTFGELATAFTKLRPHLPANTDNVRAMVLVKAAFPYQIDDSDDETAEHMWLEVLGFEGETVEGRLLNEPMFINDLAANDTLTIERSRLSDWMVQTQAGSFGPSNVAAMWRAVDAITHAGAEASP